MFKMLRNTNFILVNHIQRFPQEYSFCLPNRANVADPHQLF